MKFRPFRGGVAAISLVAASMASALPTLQLGILGGTYVDGTDETSYANGNTFKLYAFLNPGDPSATLGTNFYVSAAVVPKTTTNTNYGSFTMDGVKVNVTGDMEYGSPPLDAVLDGFSGDIQPHGIFDTYFTDFQFNFNAMNKASTVNVETNGSLAGVAFSTTGVGDLYWAEFDVDVTMLATAAAIHFDLYDQKIRDCSNPNGGAQPNCDPTYMTDDFAPFSHDAQSGSGGGGGGGPTGDPLPEPASLALVGLALFAAASTRRRKTR